MSKGNNKKPKVDAKKANAGSSYKTAQSQNKAAASPFAKKLGAGLGRKSG